MNTLAYGALWIFIFAVPWERLAAVPGLAVVTRVTGAVAIALTLMALVVSGRFRRWKLFHVAALLFVAWTGFGVIYLNLSGIGLGGAPLKFWTFVQRFLVLWMIWELASTHRHWRGLLKAYVFGACVPAIATILLYVETSGSLNRFSAGGADANNLAMTLVLGLPIAWYLSLTSRGAVAHWLYRGYVPLCMLASTLTGSRGGMLTMIVALLIIPLTLSLSPGRLAAAIAMLGLSGALAVTYVPEQVVERLGTTGSAVEEASLGGRLTLWRAGLRAFAREPVLGHGVGGFVPAVLPEMGPNAKVAHNSFISVAVEEGLIGLVLFVTMLTSVFLPLRHLPRLERRFGMVLFLTLMVAMSPLTWEDNKVTWLMLAFLTGMAAVWTAVARTAGYPRRQPVRSEHIPVAARSRQEMTDLRPHL
jgi:O-antigen ligase